MVTYKKSLYLLFLIFIQYANRLLKPINSRAPCDRWQLRKPLIRACLPEENDLKTKAAIHPVDIHMRLYTLRACLDQTSSQPQATISKHP